MSAMRGVWVDREAEIARAQAGCLLGDVDQETQLHGLAAVLGFVSMTGVAGLTLGGGFGYTTRRHGWTVDNVTGMEVVTADGEIVRASERDNPDLFWALCGGGGNFGVVTGFDYRLFPVGPQIVGGAVAWSGGDTAAVMEMFHRVATQAPPELTCVLMLRNAPPAPWLPKEVHGKPVAVVVACHAGAPADGESLVAPIKSFGQPVGDVLQRRTYTSQQSLLDATQPKGRRYYWKSEYLPDLDPAALSAALPHFTAARSPDRDRRIRYLRRGPRWWLLRRSAGGDRLATWPPDMRIICRRERPSSGAQLSWRHPGAVRTIEHTVTTRMPTPQSFGASTIELAVQARDAANRHIADCQQAYARARRDALDAGWTEAQLLHLGWGPATTQDERRRRSSRANPHHPPAGQRPHPYPDLGGPRPP